MATKITNSLTPITANGDYYVDLPAANEVYLVTVDFTANGTAGTITIKNAQQLTYKKTDGATDLVVNYSDDPSQNVIEATGERIYFTAAAFAGSPSARVLVTRRKTATL